MANSGNWNAMEMIFCDERNLSGDRVAIAKNTTMAMMASRNSGVDVPCFDIKRKTIAVSS